MNAKCRRSSARPAVPAGDNKAPPLARFAISAMSGKFTITTSQMTDKFMRGLVSLVQNEPMCALEKLSTSSGSTCLQNALSLKMDASFWKQSIVPLLEALSMDELQLGCRKQLTTFVFQNMVRVPFFLHNMAENVDKDIVDPLLALSIVDRAGTADTSLKVDCKFMKVVQVLSTKLSGQMKDHLLAKFNTESEAAILQDTTLNTLRDMKFDRHDNDFESIAEIQLLPTKEELECARSPHLPLASSPMPTAESLFDAHFRWLREDMLAPMREAIALLRSGSAAQRDLKNARQLKRFRALTFGPVKLENLILDRHGGTGFAVSFPHPKSFKEKEGTELSEHERNARIAKHYDGHWKANSGVLRKGTVVVFVRTSDGEFIRFGEILDGNRPNQPLVTTSDGKSNVTVRFDGTQFPAALHDMMIQRKEMSMIQLHVSFFAYKPILRRLQQMNTTDLLKKILPGHASSLTDHSSCVDGTFSSQPQELKDALGRLKNLGKSNGGIESLLPGCHKSASRFILDKQQCMAVELAFSTPVSLIQGPPGTGKSLCGAVIGGLLHRFTSLRVLCLCYTNHALDDFLNDLIKIGVPDSDILRIGSGCRIDPTSPIAKTRLDVVRAKFHISEERPLNRLIAMTFEAIHLLKEKALSLKKRATQMVKKRWRAVKEYLLEDEPELMDAFALHPTMDGFQIAGLSEDKLWNIWVTGEDAPKSASSSVHQHRLWTLSRSDRDNLLKQWIKDAASHVANVTTQHDNMTTRLRELHEEKNRLIMQSRRIIGCTTTGASSFSSLLDGAGVDVLIMEEAGEILEAHSIAALGKRVQQIVLIGDHLQLRPKIENFLLGIEASQGRYALDVSLFERLIQNGVPHVTLEQQHRMCHSVAAFVTELTYPSLRTAPSVRRRSLVGAPHNVMFVSHSELENCANSQKGENSLSQTNTHEVHWVAAIAQYFLCQPEYNAQDIVVLTPYLGQVLLLRRALTELCNTAVTMNEQDVRELIKAGADVDNSAGNGKSKRNEIRVATVDNFQGEEGNIVIASMVRSNANGNIGFVSQPQRINVLLSRAREAMIVVGNSSTLTSSNKGGMMWKDIIEIFRRQGAVDEGITVSCPKHRTKQLIKSPQDFSKNAPDGGCDLPCDNTLKCGHHCARSCHRGPCTKTCRECVRQKELQRIQAEMSRRREKQLAENEAEKEKLRGELDQKRLQLLQEQEKVLHIVELERLKLEQDLLDKESNLSKNASGENTHRQIQRLRKKHEEEERQLEARYANQSSGSVEGTSTARLESAIGGQHVAEHRSRISTGVHPGADVTGKDNTKSTFRGGDNVCVCTPEDEWQHLRLKVSIDQRKSMDGLISLVGLPAVKKIAVDVFKKQHADQQLKIEGFSDAVIKPTLNFSFVGNPGTGKTTVARFFAGILAESGARAGSRFEDVTASELLRLGEEKFAARISSMCGSDMGNAPPLGTILRRNLKVEVQSADKKWYAARIIKVDINENTYVVEYASDGSEEANVVRVRIRAGSELRKKGGVLFIDEAYDLAPRRNPTGAAIVNMLMEAAEKHREKLTIILAGYQKDIEEQLFAFNDGMPSRFREVVFDDFGETELRKIWDGLCRSKGYRSPAGVTEVAARYVARGRGVRGFGNARSVRSVFERACTRSLQRRSGGTPQITTEDVLGLRPSSEDKQIAGVMDELNGLIGLSRVKDSFTSLVDLAKSNYDRQLRSLPPSLVPLNRVFVGNPGTGKTTIARLYGALLKALGLLSNGEVVSKVASDFMGQFIGEAQQRTKVIVENARGKVLLVDEAYGLDDKIYGKQALNTLVERVSGAPGEDIAVVLVGYEEEIRKMIDGQNPGLKRRFNMEVCKIEFDDFNREELHALVDRECRSSGVTISDEVHAHATKLLMKQRSKPNFGNAGNVVSLIKSAVGRLTSRSGSVDNSMLSIRDIDPMFEPDADPLAPFHDLEDTPVKQHLLDLALQIQVREEEGRSTDGLLGNYVFTGAPGTGKTTIARKLAKVLFDMGVLASDLVVETSSSDLIGSYIGHSRANVEKKMKEARGGVCFIDEAYHLGVGWFGNEALTQLLTMLTMPEYMDGKTIIVLAGYDRDMHRMLESNPGLKSRFASYLRFEDWTSEKCVSFLSKLAAKEVPLAFTLDEQGKSMLRDGFDEIRSRPGWANARDVIQLYKQVITARDVRSAKGSSCGTGTGTSLITTEDISKAVCEMLLSRPAASAAASVGTEHGMNARYVMAGQKSLEQDAGATHRLKERDSVVHKEERLLNEPIQGPVKADVSEGEENEEDRETDQVDYYATLLKEVEEVLGDSPDEAHAKECEGERERLAREKREVEKLGKEKQLVLERAREAAAECERERLMEEARKKEAELQRRREKEVQRERVRRELMAVGKCVAGYTWSRCGSRYRCGGGAHFASFEEIAVRTGLTDEEVRDALN